MNRVYKRLSLVLLFVLLFSFSGCLIPEMSDPTIGFEGDLNVTSDEFVMEGGIVDDSITSDPRTYEDVTVYLYAEDGSTIREVPVGDFERLSNVSIRSDRVPRYVILDSPDFYGGEVDVVYYSIERTDWSARFVDTREELPVQPG